MERLSINEIFELEVTSFSSHGEGIGRVNGIAVFVEGALPGETVKVKVVEVKKRYAKATLLSVLTPSTKRVQPPCPLFSDCGGCQVMHANYKEQLKIKKQKVTDALVRIGHLKKIEVEDCIPSPDQLHYRNKVQMPVKTSSQTTTIGFHKRRSHDILDVETCFIHNSLGGQVYSTIRELILKAPIEVKKHINQLIIKTGVHSRQVLVTFTTTSHKKDTFDNIANEIMIRCPQVKGVLQNIVQINSKAPFGKVWNTLCGDALIQERICGLIFEISGASFFQVNTSQAEQLYQTVIEAANITADSVILDAYCGVGTLTLIAAQKAKQVYGIEVVPQAINNAKRNAKLNGIENCDFVCGLTEKLIQHYSDVETVILNPPRQGCDKAVINSLLSALPQTIIYVSCEPTTLARDLSMLEAEYSIEWVKPFDMFPQTTHVETVVKLYPA